MKVRQLIKLLTDVAHTKGDIDVQVHTVDDAGHHAHTDIDGEFYIVDDHKRAIAIVLLDKADLEQYSENAELVVDDILPKG